jgi:ribosome recycling factor
VNIKDAKTSMEKTLELFSNSLTGIRGGTVDAGFVDTLKIPYYGQLTPLKYMASVIPCAKGVSVNPHDPTMVKLIEQALNGMGVNACLFSKSSILVSVPLISGEQMEDIRKYIRKLGEEAKVSIRNIRKKHKKDVDEKELQTLTDSFIKDIELTVESKVNNL